MDLKIPKKLIMDLSRLNLSSYEWRVLWVIIAEQRSTKDLMAEISLADLVKATGIAKPHVSRSITRLSQRNVIVRFSYKQLSVYQIHHRPDEWLSFVDSEPGRPITQATNDAFEEWIEKYPNPMHIEDARGMYAQLIQSGEATIEDLSDALTGYRNHEVMRCRKMGKEPDAWHCMYPTSFLRNRWKDYIKYKDLENGPPL